MKTPRLKSRIKSRVFHLLRWPLLFGLLQILTLITIVSESGHLGWSFAEAALLDKTGEVVGDSDQYTQSALKIWNDPSRSSAEKLSDLKTLFKDASPFIPHVLAQLHVNATNEAEFKALTETYLSEYEQAWDIKTPEEQKQYVQSGLLHYSRNELILSMVGYDLIGQTDNSSFKAKVETLQKMSDLSNRPLNLSLACFNTFAPSFVQGDKHPTRYYEQLLILQPGSEETIFNLKCASNDGETFIVRDILTERYNGYLNENNLNCESLKLLGAKGKKSEVEGLKICEMLDKIAATPLPQQDQPAIPAVRPDMTAYYELFNDFPAKHIIKVEYTLGCTKEQVSQYVTSHRDQFLRDKKAMWNRMDCGSRKTPEAGAFANILAQVSNFNYVESQTTTIPGLSKDNKSECQANIRIYSSNLSSAYLKAYKTLPKAQPAESSKHDNAPRGAR